jgi:type VI secretion system protein ImpF
MARLPAAQPLLPSVLDRLLDDEPGQQVERPRSTGQILSQVRECVRRDIENLLNHRRRHLSWPAALAELEASLIGYGIPDFTGAGLTSLQSREQFRRIIQDAIRKQESRLTDVRVELLDNAEPTDRTLRLRITGVLNVEPSPEPLQFDTRLEPVHGAIEVKRAQ